MPNIIGGPYLSSHPYSDYCSCLDCGVHRQKQYLLANVCTQWLMAQSQLLTQQLQIAGCQSDISSPPPIESAPPIISDLITYRCWNINRHGLLTSVYMSNVVWLPHQPLEAPDINNTSTGIYSFKSLSDAYSYPAEVVGAIQIWGEVIEHEKGYRSQFAKIHSIISVNKDLYFNIRSWKANRKLLKYLRDTYLD